MAILELYPHGANGLGGIEKIPNALCNNENLSHKCDQGINDLPQGLKSVNLLSFYGTAEAVPFQSYL